MNEQEVKSILEKESLKHRVVSFTTKENAYFRLNVNDWIVDEEILLLYQDDIIAAKIPINDILNLRFYD
jgi:hypothetical protein